MLCMKQDKQLMVRSARHFLAKEMYIALSARICLMHTFRFVVLACMAKLCVRGPFSNHQIEHIILCYTKIRMKIFFSVKMYIRDFEDPTVEIAIKVRTISQRNSVQEIQKRNKTIGQTNVTVLPHQNTFFVCGIISITVRPSHSIWSVTPAALPGLLNVLQSRVLVKGIFSSKTRIRQSSRGGISRR